MVDQIMVTHHMDPERSHPREHLGNPLEAGSIRVGAGVGDPVTQLDHKVR